MESPEFFLAGSFRAGPPQMSQEMKFCDIKGADFFPIEDLLDFSNEDASGLPDAAAGNSTDSSTITVAETGGSCNSSFSGDCRNLTDSHFPGELCVPYDDLPELEWLSNFVEDSFSSDDFQKLQIVTSVNTKDDATGVLEYKCSADNPSASLPPARQNPSFNPDAPVPARARSKRSRTAACNWSSRLMVLSPTTSSSGSSDAIADAARRVPKEAGKVIRRREVSEHPEGRKCLHCATDKTPQWRTGPLGPKTLCNACGVRYKSGRLVPEYRPAASPTFVLTKHSNSHRKVLELRRQKELQRSQHQFLQQAAGVFDVSAGSDAGDEFLIQTGPDFRHLI
ncbi:GATA transcription factor 12-like [Nymphaea colorata]|nr:GATA transcription factor 12-like [Nymphaea colorata]